MVYTITKGEIENMLKDWRRLINSNRSLFRRISSNYRFAGPTLGSNGKIVGDMLVSETSFFNMHATDEQVEFFDMLNKINKIKAREYLLTIIGAIDKWREDVSILRRIIILLKEEYVSAEKRLSIIKKEEESILLKNAPEILKRHLPNIFKNLETDFKSFDEMIIRIKEEMARFGKEVVYLENYLNSLKKEMPFLFH